MLFNTSKSWPALLIAGFVASLEAASAQAQLPPANVGPPSQTRPSAPAAQPNNRPRPQSPWRQRFVRLDDSGGVFELRYRPPGQRRTLLRARCVPASGTISLVINPSAPGDNVPSDLVFANKIGAGLLQLKQAESGVEGTKTLTLNANHDLWFSLIKGNQLQLIDANSDTQNSFATLSLRGSALPIRAFLQECLTPDQSELQARLKIGVPATDENADRVVLVKAPDAIQIDTLNIGTTAIEPDIATSSNALFEISAARCAGQIRLSRDEASIQRPINFCAEDKVDFIDLSDVDFDAEVKSAKAEQEAKPEVNSAPEKPAVAQEKPEPETQEQPQTAENATETEEKPKPSAIIENPTTIVSAEGLQFALSEYRDEKNSKKQALHLVDGQTNQLVLQAVCLPAHNAILAQTSLTELADELSLLPGNPIMLRLSVPIGRKAIDKWENTTLSSGTWQSNRDGFLTQIGEGGTEELRLLSSTLDPLWTVLSANDALSVQIDGLSTNKFELPAQRATAINQFLQSCRTPNFEPLKEVRTKQDAPFTDLDSCNHMPLLRTNNGVPVQTSWHNMRATPVKLVTINAQRNQRSIGEVQPGHLTSFALIPGSPVRLLDENNQCIGTFVPGLTPATFSVRQHDLQAPQRFTRTHYQCADNVPLTIDFDSEIGTVYVSRAGFEAFQEISHPEAERYVHGNRELIGNGQFYELVENNIIVTKCTQTSVE